MLEYLKLTNVGPAPELELELAPRLNIITGDNGLGKSFLLDTAWWALTRKWPRDLNPRLTSGYPARPTDPRNPATIEFRLRSKVKHVTYLSTYLPRDEAWLGKSGRPWNPGLVIYAHADGGFSVWDPARNYWKTKGNVDIQDRLPGYVFSPSEVWTGLAVDVKGSPVKVCKGLLDDWSVWIRENGENARKMATILERLTPGSEPGVVGSLTRLSLNDAQDIPTIQTSYDHIVPIVHASSGIRRIAALAYMLLWSWNEHLIAAERLGEERTGQVIFLFDEVESHLHPRWQRLILKALRDVVSVLHEQAYVQLIIATHSPLILGSAEPWFDAAEDAWFDLDFVPSVNRVMIEKRPFIRRGTAGKWLTSQAFDLASEGRSIEAEDAILRAEDLLARQRSGESLPAEDINQVDEALRATLPDIDRFWVRWSDWQEKQRGWT